MLPSLRIYVPNKFWRDSPILSQRSSVIYIAVPLLSLLALFVLTYPSLYVRDLQQNER